MNNRKLKMLPPNKDHPLRRVMEAAAVYATPSELLAAIIGGSRPSKTAEALLARFKGDVFALSAAPIEELLAVSGIGVKTAVKLQAGREFFRRVFTTESNERPAIHSPADAAALVQQEMCVLEQEELRVILLDTRNRMMDVVTVYRGSVNCSQVRVGEIFKAAIRRNATSTIVVHNHPSGDNSPSPDDVAVTRAIVSAGKLLDIDVLDHIIVAANRWTSLKDRGLGFN